MISISPPQILGNEREARVHFGSSAYTQYTAKLKKQVQRHRALRPSTGLEPSEGRRSIWRSALDRRFKNMERRNENVAGFVMDMWDLLSALTDCSAGVRHVDTRTCAVFRQMISLRESRLAAQPLLVAERLAALWHDIIFDFDLKVSSQADVETMDLWLGVEAMHCEEYTTFYDPIEGDFVTV